MAGDYPLLTERGTSQFLITHLMCVCLMQRIAQRSALGHKQPFSHILSQRLLPGVKRSFRTYDSEASF